MKFRPCVLGSQSWSGPQSSQRLDELKTPGRAKAAVITCSLQAGPQLPRFSFDASVGPGPKRTGKGGSCSAQLEALLYMRISHDLDGTSFLSLDPEYVTFVEDKYLLKGLL